MFERVLNTFLILYRATGYLRYWWIKEMNLCEIYLCSYQALANIFFKPKQIGNPFEKWFFFTKKAKEGKMGKPKSGVFVKF